MHNAWYVDDFSKPLEMSLDYVSWNHDKNSLSQLLFAFLYLVWRETADISKGNNDKNNPWFVSFACHARVNMSLNSWKVQHIDY